ncbi:MAG: hypothetical protein R3B90_15805 [Planctomycetaceae bacterium]
MRSSQVHSRRGRRTAGRGQHWCLGRDPFVSGDGRREQRQPVKPDPARHFPSQFEKKDLARTYVLVEEGQDVVRGYYALSNHTVIDDALPEDQVKGLPRIDMPVVSIGRLAIDLTLQGKGLGEFLLIDALRRAQYLASKIGIRAVEVEVINDTAPEVLREVRVPCAAGQPPSPVSAHAGDPQTEAAAAVARR